MSDPAHAPLPPRRRRSQTIALALLGATGALGVGLMWQAWRDAAPEEGAAEPTVTADREYSNNEYLPGVGYYHAPFHRWFPFPLNHHDPALGYYAGGAWQTTPLAAGLVRSRPEPDAARAAQQKQRETLSGAGGAARGGAGFWSRGADGPPARPGILRGGFGGSGKPSGS